MRLRTTLVSLLFVGACTPAPEVTPPATDEGATQAVSVDGVTAEGEAPEGEAAPEPIAEEAAPEEEPATEDAQPQVLHFPGQGEFSHDAILQALAQAVPTQFKAVGTTNLVFRMRTDGEHTGAFKPRMAERRHRWRGEVAAYRLGRLLGLDNIAPAISRVVAERTMRSQLHPNTLPRWAELREAAGWGPDSGVPGAAIYWIPEMVDLGLDQNLRRWRPWLSQGGELPEEQAVLARDLSNLLVFDYLIANWDRFSGGNLSGLPDRSRIFLRDHDAGFAASLPAQIHRRLRRHLMRTERFSRSVIEAIQAMDEESLRAALAEDPWYEVEPLLTERQLAGVMERRLTLLSYVGALIDRHGEAAVLSFD